MSSTARLEGLTPEAAINVIKQKHWSDLTPEDFAFLKARESYLSEADKAIYLEGKNPEEVLQDAGRALTANERIIAENMPLQDAERRIAKAKDTASAVELAASVPLTGEQKEEADKQLNEDRAKHFETIKDGAEQLEKDAKDAAKKAENDAKEAASHAKTGRKAKVEVEGDEVK